MLNALATRLAAATPEPTPAPAGGGSVWSQSTQLADLGANGLSPNVSFLVATLLFLLAVAAGFLALSQGFTAGKGNTERTRKQGVVMGSAIGWGTVSAIGFVVVLVGAAGWFLRAAFAGS